MIDLSGLFYNFTFGVVLGIILGILGYFKLRVFYWISVTIIVGYLLFTEPARAFSISSDVLDVILDVLLLLFGFGLGEDVAGKGMKEFSSRYLSDRT